MSTITFKQNGTTRMTTTKQWDKVNRMTNIVSTVNSVAVSGSGYNYNSASQRTKNLQADGSYWVYQYDSLGQVTSGRKYWSDGSPVAGQQFDYAFDDIGNRKSEWEGGNSGGAKLRLSKYVLKYGGLNQYYTRTVPGAVDIIGAANANATVTVNNQATERKGDYYWKELGIDNSSAVWTSPSVLGVMHNGSNPDLVTSTTGSLFVPKTPESFTYDDDGNLRTDGRWTYTWDAENRLTKVESLSTTPLASKRKVEWVYDPMGRRIRQTTSDGSSGSYVVTEDLLFIHDGWRDIAELDATSKAVLRTYVWGLDLSGSMDGAGGVGGLLMLNSTANGSHFYAFDGNGNVSGLVNANNGTVTANYEYSPFGKTLRATGPLANENRYQFSTKRNDRTTDLKLYEFRVYRTDLGWLSRDPLGEWGGKNLYRFAWNDALNHYDAFGLYAQCAVAVATGVTYAAAVASLPVGAVVLGTAVSVGVVYITYKVCEVGCDQLYCANRNPTWPSCGGPSNPQSAITSGSLYPGWNVDGTPTITGTGAADSKVCPSGGTWYTLTTRFFMVNETGTHTYVMNLSVACCNCCNKFSSGKTCRVIHPGRGSGGQPPPPSDPPFIGPTYGQ